MRVNQIVRHPDRDNLPSNPALSAETRGHRPSLSPPSRAGSRFLKYTAIGGSTFAFDLLLLFLLKELLDLHYALAAGVAFAIAVSINYLISRAIVFKGTLRPLGSGYLIFVAIAGTSLVAIAILMFLCVNFLGIDYLLARVLIACLVGIWSYLMNLFVNFKVASQK